MRTVVLGLIALALSAYAASAAETVAPIKFAPGASSATVSGAVKGYDAAVYTLDASAGQSVTLAFKPNNPSCYVNVSAPSSDAALFNGSTSGNDFSGALPASGTYRVQAYLMRNAARRDESCAFTLTITIR